jgi:heptosyltransferase-3
MRILIYRLGSLGDWCVALPALRAVRQRYPQARIALLTNFPVATKAAAAAAILEDTGLIDEYMAYPVGTRNPWRLLSLLVNLRRSRFDVVVNLAAWRGAAKMKRDAAFFRLAGIPEQIGFSTVDGELRHNADGIAEPEAARLLRRIPSLRSMCSFVAKADSAISNFRSEISNSRNATLATLLRSSSYEGQARDHPPSLHVEELRRAGKELISNPQPPLATPLDLTDPASYRFDLADADRQWAQQNLTAAGISTDFIAVSLGTKVPANDWEEPNWRGLIKQLGLQYPKMALAFIGAADEHERSQRCGEQWPSKMLNLCGVCTPRQSAAVLARARLFIGHDSGPMHLAAAVGTRCVAIFAARNPPGQWFPLGVGHCVIYHKTDCCGCGLNVCTEQNKKCILSITVEEVVTAIEGYL